MSSRLKSVDVPDPDRQASATTSPGGNAQIDVHDRVDVGSRGVGEVHLLEHDGAFQLLEPASDAAASRSRLGEQVEGAAGRAQRPHGVGRERGRAAEAARDVVMS